MREKDFSVFRSSWGQIALLAATCLLLLAGSRMDRSAVSLEKGTAAYLTNQNDEAMEKGTWELVSLETRDEGTGEWKTDANWARGLFIMDGQRYTMQLVGRNRPAVTRANIAFISDEDVHALIRGYVSSLGTYRPDGNEGVYVFDQVSGFFGDSTSSHKITVAGDRLQVERTDGGLKTTWKRVSGTEAIQHPLVGMWKLEKAESRPNLESDWNPFFVGATGYTIFDAYGNRVWDVTLAGRTPLSMREALDPSADVEALKTHIRTYLVGIVNYKINESDRTLTQDVNDGIFPGEGVRDWKYELTSDGKLVITTAANMFRATYQPWSD